MIGLNTGGLFGGESDSILTQFKEQAGVTFPIGRTTDNSYSGFRSGNVGLSPFPLDVVIDRQGNIRYISREYDPAELGAVIEAALAQSAP